MRIAIDTGGTFTDCVFVRDGRVEILKVPSTPRNPAQAIGEALARIFGVEPPEAGETLDLTCGTTVGTNALLERRGGRVALVTTAGFEDVLEIGRQARPRLYDFFVEKPEPLVPGERRFGLRERIGADGRAVWQLKASEIARVARRVRRCRPECIAVCLLFSFANPAHEKAAARGLRAKGFEVCVSHEILPEFREFERTATTVLNAYLIPVMSRYLTEIHQQTAASFRAHRARGMVQVRVMQSNGGIVSGHTASREPVRTILSGPAGGVLGAQYVAGLAGFGHIITFDMGGTSTDVALLDGDLSTTNESQLAGLPVAVPILDIHTVGAGGGSLARFDRAGALRVGPESAGADPGPICYGRGQQPTVTDAHLVLGRIPASFLGGELVLDDRRTRGWMERVLRRRAGPAKGSSLRRVEDFAQGIVDVANAVMEKAIRVISVERGHDPREYTLVAFGGAGGLHACELAAGLNIPRVLVPKLPGGLSALGILRADVVRDFSQTVRLAVVGTRSIEPELHRAFARLERQGIRQMAAEGFPRRLLRIRRLLDMRYAGQAYELTVGAEGDYVQAFHRAHGRRYGYADPSRVVEVVNVRVRLTGTTPKPGIRRERSADQTGRPVISATRQTRFGRSIEQTAIYERTNLHGGHMFRGPAIVTEYSATTVVPPGWRARVDDYGNLVFARDRAGAGRHAI